VLLDLLQWPAMVVTLVAAWLVASKRRRRRHAGFWLFALSNALWIAWGWHAGSYALVLLQFGLFAMNLRGLRENPE
jgi:hypothetical protein